MNLMVLSETFPPRVGGSGRWLYELYRRLCPGRTLIVTALDPAASAFDGRCEMAIDRINLSFPSWGAFRPAGMWRYFRAARQLAAIVRRHRIDAIHCGRCLPEGALAWLLKQWLGLPYVCYVHGEELNSMAASGELRLMAGRVFRGARHLVVNSANTAGLLSSSWGTADDRLSVVYPGVDTDRFKPATRSISGRQWFGWCGRRVILTVGRLQSRKGQDRLIRAMDAIATEVPDVLYALIGDGPQRRNLTALAAPHLTAGRVQWLGELNDESVIHAMQQCDLFALPCRPVDGDIEGFGMVLVEAQACGRPVLAGRCGGTVETLRDGETGRVVDAGDPQVLAAAVASMLRDDDGLARMGEAARRWAVERFDWNVVTKSAAKVLAIEPGFERPTEATAAA